MKRLLVHFHVYYEDQIPWFLGRLQHINGCDWDLYVTSSHLSEASRESILAIFPNAVLMDVENVGYDVWPFIQVLRAVDFDRYDYVMKLHTKNAFPSRTRWRGFRIDGYRWRDLLVDALLGSPAQFSQLLERLQADPSAGLFCNSLFLIPADSPFPEDDEALAEELSRIGLEAKDRRFCAGTMFLGRMNPFRRLREADLRPERFAGTSQSHGKGSLAHVYERILSFVVTADGYRLMPVRACRPEEAWGSFRYRYLSRWIQSVFSLSRDRKTDIKYLTVFGFRFLLQGARRRKHMERKHYLVIALDVSQTAPGIVYKTLIRSLSEEADITLLAQGVDETLQQNNIRLIQLHGGVQYWGRAVKRWRRMDCNPRDVFWSWKAYRKTREEVLRYEYDRMIALVSNGYYAALNLGRRFQKNLSAPYVIYSVDGIPSPLPWLNGEERLHRHLSRGLASLCRDASVFISSNPQMMAYQQQVFGGGIPRWDYVFTPYRLLPEDFVLKPHEGYRLLYAGSLYGLRRIDGLLEAFRRFLAERPDATLTFVGETAPGYRDAAPDLQKAGRLVFRDPTDRIDDYYSEADCLIDIAADIPDDVFLSSKVVCYLPYDIPILAISGANSPVSQIMKGVPSIAQCRNDADEIHAALRCLTDVRDFSDRAALRKAFHPDSLCARFQSILES